MRRAAWIVVKDDEFYIEMALRSVIDYVEGVFILDTGSTDRTLEEVYKVQKEYPIKIIFETNTSFGCETQKFSPMYIEADARNYAMHKSIRLFKPDWIIQIDADEVFNERYWEVFEAMEASQKVFGHSTNLPITTSSVSNSPHAFVKWGDTILYDPHVRAWSTKLDVEWIKETGRHVVPKLKGHSEDLHYSCFTKDNVHFHLHRAFGPKSIYAWLTNHKLGWKAAITELNIPAEFAFRQETYEKAYPQYFKNGKFTPPIEHLDRMKGLSISISHELPSYVKDKWELWGDWERRET